MKKRIAMELIGGTMLLIAGGVTGYAYAERNRGIQGELRDARYKLESNYNGTQSEMTTVSEFQLTLVQMELYHVRYTIWNQANYAKIESDFLKDEQRWEKEFKKEQQKPSEFEGGSMAPMDRNLRMTAFVEKRIAELKSKWLKED